MADQFPVQTEQGPTSVDSFVADRQSMWTFFSNLTSYAVLALGALLLAMLIFLV